MTAPERVDRPFADLLDGLAVPGLPDRLGVPLRGSVRAPGPTLRGARDWWSLLDVLVPSTPVRAPAWRPAFALLALAVLVAVGTALVASALQRSVVGPTGPARNGEVLFANGRGEILAADAATGATRALVSGVMAHEGPWLSPDGSRYAFGAVIAGRAALYVATVDGRAIRKLPSIEGSRAAPGLTRADNRVAWSPAGDRLAIVRQIAGVGTLAIVDVDADGATVVDLPLDVRDATWRPGTGQLVVTAREGIGEQFYLVDQEGRGLAPIAASPDAVGPPAVSPDGSTLAYATGPAGRIRLVDIDTGADRALVAAATAATSTATTFESDPSFSPDGARLLLRRHDRETGLCRLVVVPVAGAGPEVRFAARRETLPGSWTAATMFSPDGAQVLAAFEEDGSTWLLDAATGEEARVPWETNGALAWQRLAP